MLVRRTDRCVSVCLSALASELPVSCVFVRQKHARTHASARFILEYIACVVVLHYKHLVAVCVCFFLEFSLLLFIFTFIQHLLLYKYLFRLVTGTVLLFARQHAVPTFFAMNLKNNKRRVNTE
jgi:hypothetical protein